MIRFLRDRRFRILRLTPDLLVRAKNKLGPDHVLLISQLFRRGEGTWGVIFGDFYYHNFDAYALSALSFLNKPALSAYVVLHPKWRIRYTRKTLEPTIPAQGRRLTVASLRKHSLFSQLRSWA